MSACSVHMSLSPFTDKKKKGQEFRQSLENRALKANKCPRPPALLPPSTSGNPGMNFTALLTLEGLTMERREDYKRRDQNVLIVSISVFTFASTCEGKSCIATVVTPSHPLKRENSHFCWGKD